VSEIISQQIPLALGSIGECLEGDISGHPWQGGLLGYAPCLERQTMRCSLKRHRELNEWMLLLVKHRSPQAVRQLLTYIVRSQSRLIPYKGGSDITVYASVISHDYPP